MKRKQMLMTLLASTTLCVGIAQAMPTPIHTLPGVTDDSGSGIGPFRVTSNITLSTGTDYLLEKTVYVAPGFTLTIQPGVIIAGDAGASLVVTRGADINAAGTAGNPITFTSLDEYNHITDSVGFPNAPVLGDNSKWGGVVILGNAPVNFYVANNPFTGVAGGNTNRGENVIEGIVAGADLDFDGLGDLIEYGQNNSKASLATPLLTAGTSDPADSSGTFTYVSIRFGGDILGLDNEVNGLTMGGVGSGTVINHVEVFNNTDDGFEWFGGTVNCNNLVSAFNQDEDFDMDEGYSGKIQFAFAIRQNAVDGLGAVENGSELDGGNGSTKTGTPLTTAQIWNATYIGAGRVGAVANLGNVFRMKDNFAGEFHNCVFDDFGANLITMDDTNTAARVTDGTLKIRNSHWGRYNGAIVDPTNGTTQKTAATTLANGTGNSSPNAKISPAFRGISRLANGLLDPRPRDSSPLLSSTLSAFPVGLQTVDYRGAFGATNWAQGWSYLSTAGYFGNLSAGNPAPSSMSELANVSDLSGTGTGPWVTTGNVTLEVGIDYLLDQTIYVRSGHVLTIQPGILIAGSSGASLVVTRGGDINAAGTASAPIVFTSLQEFDHIKNPASNPAPVIGDNSQWGGIVILGNAPINFYKAVSPFDNTTANVNQGENVIEGIVAGADLDFDGLGDLIEYGQNNSKASLATPLLTAGTSNPADSSGTFTYVSIRFGGDILGLDNEVNGLTMGGVGSGTVINHIEVLNNTDDGFEWFGGTVNCNNLVSAFNQDEDFDTDEGYSGKIQFAFAIRQDAVDGLGAVENGSELDGGNGSIKTGTPLTTHQIWNATYIGAGRVGAVASLGNVFRMKDNFAGQFHNCVFDDFGGNLILMDDTNTAARVGNELLIQNSHWGRYNGSVASGQTVAATALANGTGNTNPLSKINPLFGGISRLPNGGLDPRPLGFSPLYNSTLSTPTAGIATVNYRGAFGATNWADGWTYLGDEGYFGDLSVVDTDTDGIDDRLEQTTNLANLGFTVGVNNVSNHGGVSGTNLFSSIYTATSILDLVTGSQVMIQGGGNGGNTTLSVPLRRSSDLSTFTPAPSLNATFSGIGEKEFYRIQIGTP